MDSLFTSASYGLNKNDCFCAMYVGFLNCWDCENAFIIEVYHESYRRNCDEKSATYVAISYHAAASHYFLNCIQLHSNGRHRDGLSKLQTLARHNWF